MHCLGDVLIRRCIAWGIDCLIDASYGSCILWMLNAFLSPYTERRGSSCYSSVHQDQTQYHTFVFSLSSQKELTIRLQLPPSDTEIPVYPTSYPFTHPPLSTNLQTPRQVPHTRQPPRTIRPTLDRPQKRPKLSHRQIQNLPQPPLQHHLPLHPRQRATLASDPHIPIRGLWSRRRELQQSDQGDVCIDGSIETVFGDEGGEDGSGGVGNARVDGREDGFG